MAEIDDLKQLLIEIRDVQRQQLQEYQKVTQRSLDLQQQAVNRQEQLGKLYRRVVLAGALLILCLCVALFYLLGRLP